MARGDEAPDIAATATAPAGMAGKATPPPVSASAWPAQIGRFTIESKLGEGGMGLVLLATDSTLGRRVALKLLREASAANADGRRRFLREAQVMARLAHENVVVVHEVGEHEGQGFVAMEYVAGGTLRGWHVGRPWREVVAMYVRAGRGLEAAHRGGLVHRDFKPDNVLVGEDGRVRVTDFGLAAIVAGEAAAPAVDATPAPADVGLTRTGAVMGTPRYMAPEQFVHADVDARADQFAFCVALYEAVYGQAAFRGDSFAELATSVTAGAPAAPPAGSPVPPRVHAAIMRGLARAPAERFATMGELLAELESEAQPLAPQPPPRRPRRTLALVLGGVAVAGAAIAGGLWVHGEATRERERAAALEAQLTELKAAGSGSALDDVQAEFDGAQEAYASAHWDMAAKLFLQAYANRPFPDFLFNAASAHRMKAKRQNDIVAYGKAIALYRRYLEAAPAAADTAKVTEIIADLEADVARLQAGSGGSAK